MPGCRVEVRATFQAFGCSDYMVLASRDLLTWPPVFEETAQEGPIEYIDSEAFKFPYRFYRLLTGDCLQAMS